MTSVKTESVSRKLEQIIDFRVGEEAFFTRRRKYFWF